MFVGGEIIDIIGHVFWPAVRLSGMKRSQTSSVFFISRNHGQVYGE